MAWLGMSFYILENVKESNQSHSLAICTKWHSNLCLLISSIISFTRLCFFNTTDIPWVQMHDSDQGDMLRNAKQSKSRSTITKLSEMFSYGVDCDKLNLNEFYHSQFIQSKCVLPYWNSIFSNKTLVIVPSCLHVQIRPQNSWYKSQENKL